jgi:hypothetical protein
MERTPGRVTAGHGKYYEELYEQRPLAVQIHEMDGILAYLGFVNGDSTVPYTGLVTSRKNYWIQLEFRILLSFQLMAYCC